MSDPFFARPTGAQKRKRPSRTPKSQPNNPSTSKLVKKGASKGKGRSREREDEIGEDDEAGEGGFDSDDDIISGAGSAESGSDEDRAETPAQKRLRLAKLYLEGLEDSRRREAGGYDAAELDREHIASRLQQDVLETSGRIHLFLSSRLARPSTFRIHHSGRNQHRLPVTSAVVSPDGKYIYAASKDGRIIKYNISAIWKESIPSSENAIRRVAVMSPYLGGKPPEGKQQKKGKAKAKGPGVSQATEAQVGHEGAVLTLSISGDGKILASGGVDRLIGVWDVSGEGAVWIKGLRGHKDTIASVAFRLGTTILFSSSFDRTVNIYDLTALSYSETLYGHQDSISSLATLRDEVAVTAGGRDKTCRYWKIPEESQLIFRGGSRSKVRDLLEGAALEEEDEEQVSEKKIRKREEQRKTFVEGSIDCVTMIDNTNFLSGGDSGSICLWSTGKKKPVYTQMLAHGLDTHSPSPGDPPINTPRWITALTCLPYGDVFASGSWNGEVRLWQLSADCKSFAALGLINIRGIINSLQLVYRPSTSVRQEGEQLAVIVGVGQEPRLGRWKRIKDVRNGIVVALADLSVPQRNQTANSR